MKRSDIRHQFISLSAFVGLLFCPLLLAAEDVPDLKKLVKKVQPGTVQVLTYDAAGKSSGLGSGFFISPEGDVVTNFHVLWGAARAEIKTSDGKIHKVVRILDEDEVGDLIRLAVDIPSDQVHPLALCKTPAETGERVAVIGSPLGLEQTVSDGIVSAVRELPGAGSMIQISAPISPGSSGSPVVNMKGEVIGVARLSLNVGQNLNFAVPAERVAKLGRRMGKTLHQWQWEKYVSSTQRLLKKYPDDADMWWYLSGLYEDLGRWPEASDAQMQVVRIKPEDFDARTSLASLHEKAERWDEAIEAYKQAIRIKPDDGHAHLCLGEIHMRPGRDRPQEAIKEFKLAIKSGTDTPYIHFILGLAYLRIADRASALDEYKILKGLAEDQGFADNLFSLIYKE